MILLFLSLAAHADIALECSESEVQGTAPGPGAVDVPTDARITVMLSGCEAPETDRIVRLEALDDAGGATLLLEAEIEWIDAGLGHSARSFAVDGGMAPLTDHRITVEGAAAVVEVAFRTGEGPSEPLAGALRVPAPFRRRRQADSEPVGAGRESARRRSRIPCSPLPGSATPAGRRTRLPGELVHRAHPPSAVPHGPRGRRADPARGRRRARQPPRGQEAPVVQVEADDRKDRYLLLFQLGPDHVMDRSIGEMGPLQYWITPEDLAAKRFDKTGAHDRGVLIALPLTRRCLRRRPEDLRRGRVTSRTPPNRTFSQQDATRSDSGRLPGPAAFENRRSIVQPPPRPARFVRLGGVLLGGCSTHGGPAHLAASGLAEERVGQHVHYQAPPGPPYAPISLRLPSTSL
jgi:hypothetical protein